MNGEKVRKNNTLSYGYAVYNTGHKCAKMNVHAMQNPTVLHSETPHTEHTALCLHGTTALQRITFISTREREREETRRKEADKIHSTQICFSHKAEALCDGDIRDFKTLRQIDFV